MVNAEIASVTPVVRRSARRSVSEKPAIRVQILMLPSRHPDARTCMRHQEHSQEQEQERQQQQQERRRWQRRQQRSKPVAMETTAASSIPSTAGALSPAQSDEAQVQSDESVGDDSNHLTLWQRPIRNRARRSATQGTSTATTACMLVLPLRLLEALSTLPHRLADKVHTLLHAVVRPRTNERSAPSCMGITTHIMATVMPVVSGCAVVASSIHA